MNTILEQLELDHTFFIEFAIFAVLFAVLAGGYFRPFMKLFEARHKRTIGDREAAEKLIAQAEAKFQEYRERLGDERTKAKKIYEDILTEAKKEEAAILAAARNDAKKITQDAVESMSKQTEQVKKVLQADVENLAKSISDILLKGHPDA